jgi:hypothetical protein
MKRVLTGLLAVFLLVWLSGCASMNRTEKGALIGAGGGALVGGLI